MALAARCVLLIGTGVSMSRADPSLEHSLAERALGIDEERHIGNLCDGKHDGWRCKDDHAVRCSGQRVAEHEACAFYQDCEDEAGSAWCEEDACDDKVDGLHCSDDHVVECLGRKTVNFTKCESYQKCRPDWRNPGSASCEEKVCSGKANGAYCNGDHEVVECVDSIAVNVSRCAVYEECEDGFPRGSAQCQEDDCNHKADGSYCKHGGVIECRAQQTANFTKCPFYQECSRRGRHLAVCEEDACDDEADGWHCKGDHMVLCSGYQTVDFQLCAPFTECEEYRGEAQCL